MTTIEATVKLLKEYKKPMNARELAKEILKRGMVKSNAIDKITSIAATIQKSIANYDNEDFPICYMDDSNKNRLIGLKEWEKNKEHLNITLENPEEETPKEVNLTVKLSDKLLEKLNFTYHAKIRDTFEEYICYLLELGLELVEDDVKKAFNQKIKDIYGE